MFTLTWADTEDTVEPFNSEQHTVLLDRKAVLALYRILNNNGYKFVTIRNMLNQVQELHELTGVNPSCLLHLTEEQQLNMMRGRNEWLNVRAIGEVFKYKGVALEVIENPNDLEYPCKGCYFDNATCSKDDISGITGDCGTSDTGISYRYDKRSVIFKQVHGEEV